MALNKDAKTKGDNTALTAVALQDHLVKSLGLNDFIGPRHIGMGPAARAKQKKNIKSTIDTGRFGRNKPKPKQTAPKEEEYVLDPKPPPLTLAQKFGLIEAPDQLLSEDEWKKVKDKSNKRDDSKLPCVICKEDFGTQEQACLQAFERFTGKKTCPMCRKEQYQTRVIHEGSRYHRHKCATMIQSCWRGYVVRCMYLKLRESNPPKDPRLRQKFYEEKLHKITDRMVRSCDFDVNNFLREMDRSLEASRNVFKDFDARFQQLSDEDWEDIQLKAVERGQVDCPICLTLLVKKSYIGKPEGASQKSQTVQVKLQSNTGARGKSRDITHKQGALKSRTVNEHVPVDNAESDDARQNTKRRTVLLSCSHVFHETCLDTFEELSLETNNSCPVCRSKYQKKVLNV
ncbi:RING finger protein 32 [Mactra antiquata]